MSSRRLVSHLALGASVWVAGCSPLRARRPASDAPGGHVYRVYYLGGQSNMEGFGFVSELPEAWLVPHPTARIYEANSTPDNQPVDGRGVWEPAQPGHGLGFRTDGLHNERGDRFGPELAFASRMAVLEPAARVAVIKYARGGSSIAAGASGFGT